MATATIHVCSVFTISCEKRNSLFNHSPFSFTLLSNLASFRPFTFSGVYLSANIFWRTTPAPVVCMAQRYAPNTTKRKRLSRKRGGDPDKKRHRRRKGSKKKKLFKIIKLVSAGGTGFVYAKKKSRKMDRLEMKKYDPNLKRHVVFKEIK